ncbi:YjbE family putative metal transport protein [Devosia sp. MC521]|uniref:YjbE family putative metal transport protein n=1 Tax=Devosia sp. MC521 TaxID=2759954 RepID=UPI0015FA103B|nr:YjbE family putative metal transport protein [Devosia sp. MC521]MBJ6986554.1 YjbE family putative metal transport protein [Devosia sp. MC521]QMW61599.1 YjbE family putative metal transport protein [Devosia sp. MC521]
MFGIDSSFLSSLLQVIFIDLVLAGDNAVVIGLAAAGLASDLRRKAILIGILAATGLRIIFALITIELLSLGGGLLVAGGALLFWVCWKMYRELSVSHQDEVEAHEALDNADINADGRVAGKAPKKTLRQAVTQIVIADVSMSLDNVLAVAGAAQHHIEAMVFGLALSVVLMGVAASFIARLLHKFRWIAWVGLLIILFVAVRMLLEGVGSFVAIPEIPFLYTPHVAAAH